MLKRRDQRHFHSSTTKSAVAFAAFVMLAALAAKPASVPPTWRFGKPDHGLAVAVAAPASVSAARIARYQFSIAISNTMSHPISFLDYGPAGVEVDLYDAHGKMVTDWPRFWGTVKLKIMTVDNLVVVPPRYVVTRQKFVGYALYDQLRPGQYTLKAALVNMRWGWTSELAHALKETHSQTWQGNKAVSPALRFTVTK